MFHVYLRKILILSALLVVPVVANGQDPPLNPAAPLLPERVGDTRAAARTEAGDPQVLGVSAGAFTSVVSRTYVSKDGQRFFVTAFTTPSDAAAYSVLAGRRVQITRQAQVTAANVGTDAFSFRDAGAHKLTFFKGPVVVSVRDDGKSQDPATLLNFGRALAETMDRGEGEIPVLVKHLPGWPAVQDRALYILNQDELKRTFTNQSVLETVSFDGGTEVVTADYQGPKLVLIEFKTPQIATDNDGRIVAKIQELRSQGQTVPAAYRRVGNYSVFVFDAQNEQAANQLIDQVQYQQVVRWLGRNPNIYDRAVNEFSRTTLGVFIAVVKASGLVIIGSLALGGLLGAVLFRVRRKQQRLAQAYSDAGGMLRLNIDELTATHDPARLIGRRD